MLFRTHKEEIIQKNIKKLKPLKYNKFYWWRRYSNNEQPITKRHSILDKIKAGYYDFPAAFWDSQLCLLEMNKSYLENIKDYRIFIEKNGVTKSRYKRLMDDYNKEEQIKLQRIIDDFTNNYILKEDQVIKILENFNGTIQELYEYFEKNHSYAYGVPSFKKTF
jgi:hypothetical protein